MIRAFFVTLISLAYILVVGTPFLIQAVLTRNTDTLYRIGRWGARMAVWLAGVRLEIHGLEKIPAGRAVVFMSNHQSNCEGPALFSILPPLLVLAKKEFFRVPVLGRAMVLRGFIPVDRKNRERAIQALEMAAKSLKAGHSFLVFPEGTRSPDGRLQPFKKGVFVMAINAGAAVVPVSVSGGSKIMRKGEFAIRPGVLRMTIQDPISTERYAPEDRERVMQGVREAILRGLAPEEWPLEHAAESKQGPTASKAASSM